ncbi:biotin carboxylase N-terminal domain-containing protein [Streptomyces sp. NPDC047108]|uniref:acetyl/propionyl/methylcrotonyl-CoA carboxylase subunit alpha n=1 Tax=Streptomyces sp. NPDC047108 TaxID=3155025 RepID=UPI0033EBCFA0
MIQSVLVANRGEIARRVFRTCRELGVATVAVYADPDAGAPHVQEADAAVRLPGSAPTETYLRGDLIVKAALAAGADAVHPGYGFLSENAGFARAVLDAGLTWIGPSPEAIEAMASKTRAKELMREAGVPLLAPVDPDAATEADLPLLVKAAAGGGGRGMRVVRELGALPEELKAAAAEAASAFGDGEVFAEPYVERGRHVEVQILADGDGTVWALGTRDCSLQRRHQKVIEEAPAPGLDDALRHSLHTSAAEAARAIGYTGAGTVEFLVSADGRPYFLEMNTRLQVEHPVTEEVFGLDLVALQLRVAEGGLLAEVPPQPSGHAIEARLYAEDPARGWQPQTGVLHRFAVEQPAGGNGGLRVDSGYADGDEIGVHYDPMIAKVIAWAPTRAEAVRKLARALERAHVHGPVTNRDLLVRSLRHPDFGDVGFDTGWLERKLSGLTEDGTGPSAPGPSSPARLAALAAALADAAARSGEPGGTVAAPTTAAAPTAVAPPTAAAPAAAAPTTTVASRLGGWRNVSSRPQTKRYRGEPDGTEHEVRYRLTRDGLTADDCPGVRLLASAPDRVVLEADGVRREFRVASYGTRVHVDSAVGSFAFTALSRFPEPTARTEPGSLLAPMPGTVIRVAEVAVGDTVAAGQPLLWLEAMKMEHKVSAPTAGTLTELQAVPGRQVEVGALLAVVTEAPDGAAPPDDTARSDDTPRPDDTARPAGT